MIRNVATAVGLGLLFATAHVTITKTTGYHDAHAALVLAIAAGVGVGAWGLGVVWSEGRIFLALMTGLAMLSGELFGLAQTGDRIAAERERQQAPARSQMEAHTRAAKRVETASAKLAGLPATTPRLEAALAQKASADNATLAKSAERGCATHCRALLEQQVGLAQSEVDAARAELQAERTKAERELASARDALNAAPLPAASGTPLADRLGIDPAKLDMIVAALGAFGANGLAACLIALGAHRPRHIDVAKLAAETASEAVPKHAKAQTSNPPAVVLLASPQRAPRQHAAEFSVRCLKPAPNGALPVSRLHARYASWCDENGYPRLSPPDLARELTALFSDHGIPIEQVGKELAVRGVALAE